MNMDEALGEAVTGHRVTCNAIGLDNWIDYGIGKGWRVNLATGSSYQLTDTKDSRYSGDIWYYWKEPIKDSWGKERTPGYNGIDADLILYDELDNIQAVFGQPGGGKTDYVRHLQQEDRALRPSVGTEDRPTAPIEDWARVTPFKIVLTPDASLNRPETCQAKSSSVQKKDEWGRPL